MLTIFLTLLAFGVCFWLVSTYVLPKVPDPFRTLIVILGVLFLCYWILNVTGVLHGNALPH